MRDYHIRRDRSALTSGRIFRGGARRGSPLGWIAVAIGIGAAALVLWQFNAVQRAVLEVVGVKVTPTMTVLESAHQGDLAYQRGDLNASVAYYEQAVQMSPADVDILYELVRMLIYRSFSDDRNFPDIERAKQYGAQAVQVAPDNPRALAINCFALARAGQSEQAAQTCNQAIRLAPDNADAHAYLAQAYYDLSRYDVASEAARRALELNPQSIEGNTVYGLLLMALRRDAQAIEYFKKAALVNPRLEFPYYNLAIYALAISLNRDDDAMYQTAIRAYDQVLAMNKRSVKAYTSLCRAYFSRGEQNLARDNCKTATELDAAYTPAWRWLGEINYRTMAYEEAVTAFEGCVQHERSLPAGERQSECWVYGGLAYVQMGQCARAMPLFDEVLNWTRSAHMIELVNTGIRLCTGRAPAPPAPTPTAPSTG